MIVAAAVLLLAPAPPEDVPEVWEALAECESSGRWDLTPAEGGNIFEGGLQHHPDTWDAFRPGHYPDAAYDAAPRQQVAVAERVLDVQGWGAWPVCSRKLGLGGDR